MVKLNKIYTKTGDDGTTGLGNGARVWKYDLRVEAYGTVDEANSAIGMARIHTVQSHVLIDAMLARIQNDMFDLGADLATPDEGKELGYQQLRVTAAQVARIEQDIDALNAHIPPLHSFILPGGAPASAELHLARTIARRAERLMVELAGRPQENISRTAIEYINRVSDFLFVAARAVNDNGQKDVLWVPGANR